MTANITPIFPNVPYIGRATLTSATAITSRANISGTTGLVKLTDTTTNGVRIDAITVKGKATTVASCVGIWLYDGTTSELYDEIDVTAVTASTTVDSFSVSRTYSNLTLGPNDQLYISETVQTDLNVFSFGGKY